MFDLSKQGVQMYVDAERIPPVGGCSPGGPTLCVGSASDSCEAGWSSSRLTELVVSAREQRDETLYLLRVQPDVPLQHVVSLMEAIAYPPKGEQRGSMGGAASH